MATASGAVTLGCMFAPHRISTELRIAGPALLAAAIGVPVLGAVLVVLMAATGSSHADVARMGSVVLEGVCPLAIAIAVISLVGRDPCMELALTTPSPYRRILLFRASLVAGLGGLVALLAAAGFSIAGWWPAGIGPAGVLLVWLSPTVALTGVGLLVGLFTASAAAGSSVTGGIWMVEALFASAFSARPVLRVECLFATIGHLHGGQWWASRIGLLATGLVALAAAGVLLGQRARLARLLMTEAS